MAARTPERIQAAPARCGEDPPFGVTLPGVPPMGSPGLRQPAVTAPRKWQGGRHDRSSDQRPASRTHHLRAPDRAGKPLRRRDVGTVLVLRDAHDPRLLPVLLGDRRRAGVAAEHRHRARRRLRRVGVPVDGARRLGSRPAARHGAHRVLRRCRGDVGPHRTGRRTGSCRSRRRPGAGRAGVRCAQGERVVVAGHALRQG
jgi:hypothetical protein